MAPTKEKFITIDNFAGGIASSPHVGFEDMRGCNIDTNKGTITANQRMIRIGKDSVSTSFTANISDVITTATDIFNNVSTGTPVFLHTTNSFPGGITGGAYTDSFPYTIGEIVTYTDGKAYRCITETTAGIVPTNKNYWIENTYYLIQLTGTTYKLATTYNNAQSGIAIDLTDVGVGFFTLTSIVPGFFNYIIQGYSGEIVGLDNVGRLWTIGANVTLRNDNNSKYNANGNGLVYWKGYYFIFRNHYVDVFNRKTGDWTGSWTNNWQTLTSAVGRTSLHQAIISRNDDIYFIDYNDGLNNTETNYIGRIRENLGETFDPLTSSTYTYSNNVLDFNEFPYCISELGSYLTVGCDEKILFWNKKDTSYNYDLLIANNSRVEALLPYSTNLYAFVSSGVGGGIYECNEISSVLQKKLPEYLFENNVYTLTHFHNGGVDSNGKKLYFNIWGNAGNSGTWSYDTESKSIILENWSTDYILGVEQDGSFGDINYGGKALLWSGTTYYSSYSVSSNKNILNQLDTSNKISSISASFTTPFISSNKDSKQLEEINYYFDRNMTGNLYCYYRHSLSDVFTQIPQPTNSYWSVSDCDDTEFYSTRLQIQLPSSQKNLQIKTVINSGSDGFNNSPVIKNIIIK